MNATNDEQILEFKELLEETRKQLLDACIHFQIWKDLWPTEEVVGTINRYKGFFLPTRNAHLDRFYIKVCNLLSNDKNSPSFYRLFRILRENPDLAQDANLRELSNNIKKHKDVLKGIEQYRNTRVAHWDIDIQEERKPVLFGDCQKMLEELQKVFNTISQSHSKAIWEFRLLEHADTNRVLGKLKK